MSHSLNDRIVRFKPNTCRFIIYARENKQDTLSLETINIIKICRQTHCICVLLFLSLTLCIIPLYKNQLLHKSGIFIIGVSITSGNLITIVDKITITIENNPIQFCLYGATTSSRSRSFEIDPSIAFCCLIVCLMGNYVE